MHQGEGMNYHCRKWNSPVKVTSDSLNPCSTFSKPKYVIDTSNPANTKTWPVPTRKPHECSFLLMIYSKDKNLKMRWKLANLKTKDFVCTLSSRVLPQQFWRYCFRTMVRNMWPPNERWWSCPRSPGMRGLRHRNFLGWELAPCGLPQMSLHHISSAIHQCLFHAALNFTRQKMTPRNSKMTPQIRWSYIPSCALLFLRMPQKSQRLGSL